MKLEKFEEGYSVPVKSWCENCEDGAVKQVINLAKHPAVDIGCGMMEAMKEPLAEFVPEVNFLRTIDIHHNYEACEEHFGKKVFVHRWRV